MPQLSEDEAREFLSLLERIDGDMKEAMGDLEDLANGKYREKWGARPTEVELEAGRDNYRSFVEHAYLGEVADESEKR
ncbi:hypothetical protein [Candidatus Halobonum tyrrellensis]|uniref:hypothetical protein n=1 Tax=Candidatus Halobonum tyrrellensis TaxID=1431545 RepID=UPI001267D894|nr:hypothetical protein [Candidatus Halobonum tyrrellensis]